MSPRTIIMTVCDHRRSDMAETEPGVKDEAKHEGTRGDRIVVEIASIARYLDHLSLTRREASECHGYCGILSVGALD